MRNQTVEKFLTDVLENSAKNLAAEKAAYEKMNSIFEYIGSRTKLDRSDIKKYNDLTCYYNNHGDTVLDKDGKYTNKLTRCLSDFLELVQIMRKFNNLELLFPFMEELDKYGIHFDIDNDGDVDKIELSAIPTKKGAQEDIDNKFKQTNELQHEICGYADEVNINDASRSDGVQFAPKSDYRKVANAYAKIREGGNPEKGAENFMEKRHRAAKAMQETVDRKVGRLI